MSAAVAGTSRQVKTVVCAGDSGIVCHHDLAIQFDSTGGSVLEAILQPPDLNIDSIVKIAIDAHQGASFVVRSLPAQSGQKGC